MKAVKLSRKIHKWFALVIGVQLFLWALSGFYMVAVHIDIIHGDMLIKEDQQDIRAVQGLYASLGEVAALHPNARKITLTFVAKRPVYLVEGGDTRLLDALDGQLLSPIDERLAIEIAAHHYIGKANIRHVELLESNPPTELQARALPLWRVDFDDKWNSTFYIDPTTGAFTARRHTLWRVFDFLWMLHVMD